MDPFTTKDHGDGSHSVYYHGKHVTLDDLLQMIRSLQQKLADLERAPQTSFTSLGVKYSIPKGMSIAQAFEAGWRAKRRHGAFFSDEDEARQIEMSMNAWLRVRHDAKLP